MQRPNARLFVCALLLITGSTLTRSQAAVDILIDVALPVQSITLYVLPQQPLAGPQPPSNLRIVGTSSPASVSPSAGSAQSAAINMSFATALKAIVRDASATPLSGITVTFTAPASGATARFGGSATTTAITDASGIATALALTANGTTGTYSVTGTVAGASTANFSLTNTSGGGGVGTWTDVTPSSFSLNPNSPGSNFGVQDIVVDPARPSDLYAASTYQGLWKSTDYGLTWTKISTGQNGAGMNGKMWTLGIDPNPNRNPATPPMLYTSNWGGTAGMGLWKSSGGVDWAPCGALSNQDVYSVDLDPYDSQHLIVGFHESTGVSESTDGCATWRNIAAAPGGNISVYPFFIDTGNAATTRQTWLVIGQLQDGVGTYRTTDQGASFTQVSSLGHGHGNIQIFQAGGGVIYMAGQWGPQGNGVYRSADFGATWTMANGGVGQSNVFGTPNFIYADNGWATSGGQSQILQRAPRNPGTSWTNYMATPSGMSNGSKRAAVTFNGTRYIIVSGNWLAGFWRYVE